MAYLINGLVEALFMMCGREKVLIAAYNDYSSDCSVPLPDRSACAQATKQLRIHAVATLLDP